MEVLVRTSKTSHLASTPPSSQARRKVVKKDPERLEKKRLLLGTNRSVMTERSPGHAILDGQKSDNQDRIMKNHLNKNRNCVAALTHATRESGIDRKNLVNVTTHEFALFS